MDTVGGKTGNVSRVKESQVCLDLTEPSCFFLLPGHCWLGASKTQAAQMLRDFHNSLHRFVKFLQESINTQFLCNFDQYLASPSSPQNHCINEVLMVTLQPSRCDASDVHKVVDAQPTLLSRSRDLWRTSSIFANNGERGFAVPEQVLGVLPTVSAWCLIGPIHLPHSLQSFASKKFQKAELLPQFLWDAGMTWGIPCKVGTISGFSPFFWMLLYDPKTRNVENCGEAPQLNE